MDQILNLMRYAAQSPMDYAAAWKERTGRQVIGLLPMHFPGELAHAAGCLPLVIQDDAEPITVGQAGVFNFYCGFNRSLIDQTMRGSFDCLDAIMFGDHCVQLLGTADTIRAERPELPILFNQLCTTLDANWAERETIGTFTQLWKELESLTGRAIAPEAASASIALFNRNRTQMRELYELRRQGRIAISGRDMQLVVKSSMVMDKADHVALMDRLLREIPRVAAGSAEIPLYLSGHMCHAPKPEIIDMIEECGARIVNDDLFVGWRFIHADMDEARQPVEAMAHWYLEKNQRVPCPTRTMQGVDWEDYLLSDVQRSGARGLVILMVKFCEPHMYFYPEIKEAFESRGIPHLLIETEHEEMPIEALKTRVETFVEIAKRRATEAA
ncbi:2-hydroxyacyl-CoA dehydratase subunit D [Mesorhizobium australicum]|uniref:2-hydroxyglutaryl-CoA dehydratase, D-component n=1 Tax=Mesorhizobium australicum TaxID=536018 RepID=A0A1X7PRS9_9HYPH|nr:2-hydroxyacyl-CoA dehydratase family protein [Mesorhizobium australicum]SMH54697.1 2-hydroxyglutaryl-CoA dehydratase, D-component [Mesorhizobium australicum]